jgi:hypothetical protein
LKGTFHAILADVGVASVWFKFSIRLGITARFFFLEIVRLSPNYLMQPKQSPNKAKSRNKMIQNSHPTQQKKKLFNKYFYKLPREKTTRHAVLVQRAKK